MTVDTEPSGVVRSYYVDEAGDGNLFGTRGNVIIGTEGCSRYFALGLVDLSDDAILLVELEELREQLLADPYFRGVPSMRTEAKKTAVTFHAKDDLPEVRREVFALLQRHAVRFLAVVRDKHAVLEYVRERNERDRSHRYNPNELYDSLVRRLFRNLLHKDDGYNVYFARRGSSDRTEALHQALDTARQRFLAKSSVANVVSVNVMARRPAACPGLQVADYFLWSLQRFYERGEDRYMQLLWPSIRMVHDVDDTRQKPYGVYYTQKKPLTLAALREEPGI